MACSVQICQKQAEFVCHETKIVAMRRQAKKIQMTFRAAGYSGILLKHRNEVRTICFAVVDVLAGLTASGRKLATAQEVPATGHAPGVDSQAAKDKQVASRKDNHEFDCNEFNRFRVSRGGKLPRNDLAGHSAQASLER